ncbi:MAG: DNA repair protein RecO [Steroidobacteraceae bacterium]
MKGAQRVWLTPAFVLHQHAWRDSSRIVEIFSREHGRLSLFARGARSPKSALRATLRPFQSLLMSWSSRSEAGQLTAAEVAGEFTQLPSPHLMSGFYLNELLLKLTERFDPHPAVFDGYVEALEALRTGREEPALRRFEKRLLEELGYGADFTLTGAGEPVQAQAHYQVRPQRPITRCEAGAADAISGRSLIELAQESFDNGATLRDAKKILRAAIEACLDGRTLGSRDIMRSLHART